MCTSGTIDVIIFVSKCREDGNLNLNGFTQRNCTFLQIVKETEKTKWRTKYK